MTALEAGVAHHALLSVVHIYWTFSPLFRVGRLILRNIILFYNYVVFCSNDHSFNVGKKQASQLLSSISKLLNALELWFN